MTAKRHAFDHDQLAAALSTATGEKYTAFELPFTQVDFVDNEKAIEFFVDDDRWRCDNLLVLGEMDTNVDPASTMQVVNALIKADKMFDLLVIPGANHGPGGAYGEKKRNDFFVHHLLGVEPPDWNKVEKRKTVAADGN
jgi:hypothetical protein